MAWEVEYTDEFEAWWSCLTIEEQESVTASVELLENFGTNLKFPHSSGVNGSRHGHMRELRTQHQGRPFRTLYAFDPSDKTGDGRWYDTHIPIADQLYDEHLEQLKQEGLL